MSTCDRIRRSKVTVNPRSFQELLLTEGLLLIKIFWRSSIGPRFFKELLLTEDLFRVFLWPRTFFYWPNPVLRTYFGRRPFEGPHVSEDLLSGPLMVRNCLFEGLFLTEDLKTVWIYSINRKSLEGLLSPTFWGFRCTEYLFRSLIGPRPFESPLVSKDLLTSLTEEI